MMQSNKPLGEPRIKDDRLLTVAETAYLLAMKVSTVYQWISDQRIPVVKFRRSVRIKLSVIHQLIAEAERPARRIG
jgi:excisionase family DNA binding protein